MAKVSPAARHSTNVPPTSLGRRLKLPCLAPDGSAAHGFRGILPSRVSGSGVLGAFRRRLYPSFSASEHAMYVEQRLQSSSVPGHRRRRPRAPARPARQSEAACVIRPPARGLGIWPSRLSVRASSAPVVSFVSSVSFCACDDMCSRQSIANKCVRGRAYPKDKNDTKLGLVLG